MPSVSTKQHNFMEAAMHNPSFARRAGISRAVAREFVQADAAQGKKRKPKRARHTAARNAIRSLIGNPSLMGM